MPRYRTRTDSLAMEDAPDVRVRDVEPAPAVGRVPGNAVLTATLPNGRTTWFRVDPAPVPIDQINRLARTAARADVRHALHIRDTARALGRLSRTLSRDVEKVGTARLARQRKLGTQLTKGDAKLDAKLTKATKQLDATGNKRAKGLMRAAVRIRRRAVWDYAVLASAAPLFAAFGQFDKPWGGHNVTLAAALGVWLAGDEISDFISGRPDDPPTLVRDVDLWSYLAPAGNLLAGHWLLRDAQHQRFVTGTAAGQFTVQVDEVVVPIGDAAAPVQLSANTFEAVMRSVTKDRAALKVRVDAFESGLSTADKAQYDRALAALGTRMAALPISERRSLFPVATAWFVLDSDSPGVIAPDEVDEFGKVGTSMGLSAAEVAAAAAAPPASDVAAAALDALASRLRAAPLDERRAMYWLVDALFAAEATTDPAIGDGLAWIYDALGLGERPALEVEFTQTIDLANTLIAPGFADDFVAQAVVPATAVLSTGTIAPEFETSRPQVTARVEGGVLTIGVRILVFGCTKGIEPAPLSVDGAAATDAGAPPVVRALVAAPSGKPADVRRARLLANSRLGYVAARKFAKPEKRTDRFDLSADLADLFDEHLWTTRPSVAWIVDTLVPK